MGLGMGTVAGLAADAVTVNATRALRLPGARDGARPPRD